MGSLKLPNEGISDGLEPKNNSESISPLIKSPTEDLPQDTQQNESEAKNEDS